MSNELTFAVPKGRILDEALPVDISVNGGCSLTNVAFRTISNPVPLEAGRYDIEVRLANAEAPCTGALAITGTFNIQLGENSAVVAHLTEERTPTLTKFVNDLQPTMPEEARAVARHTASAPPVAVSLTQAGVNAVVPDIRNSEQRAAEVPAGSWDATIQPFLEDAIGPITLELQASAVNIVYAVGSLKNGTFEPLIQVLHITP